MKEVLQPDYKYSNQLVEYVHMIANGKSCDLAKVFELDGKIVESFVLRENL